MHPIFTSTAVLLSLAACAPTAGNETAAVAGAPDLTETLDADEVRVGVVTDTRALFGGISSEGAPGDIKLYNDRARFIIEAVGDSSYYVDYGGGLIDADIVRPAGQPGRDLLDELAPMVSFGRVCDATSVEIVEDGEDGVGHVRVTGPAAPMRLITGAVENEDAVPWFDLTVTTDYVLRPGQWSVEVTTTVQNHDSRPFPSSVGMLVLYAQEVADLWHPGTGFADPDGAPYAMEAIVGSHNEAVFALMASSGTLEPSPVGELISGIGAGMTAFGEAAVVPAGDSRSWTGRAGVAPDLATLEVERLEREGAIGVALEGVVTAGGSPVPGARVHALDVSGNPVTIGVTDADGRYSVSATGAVTVVAAGRGPAIHPDLAIGHGNVSAYDRSADNVLESLAAGALPIPFAEGYGVSAAGTGDLALQPPGTLTVTIADGGPAGVLVDFASADPGADERLVPGRPSGHAALGYVRDGQLSLPLEPGSYLVTVHRGVRYELVTSQITIESGGTAEVAAALTRAYEAPGVVTMDPHSHASPSADGDISMEDRIMVAAGNGIEVHVGTDHDHVADYTGIVAALGLGDWLHSIVADEVSPVLRGHFNAYPAARTGANNGGAPRWWQQTRSTSELFAFIRRELGDDVLIQANHPVGGSGLFSLANYLPGTGRVGDADHWSSDFDSMELINSGHGSDYFPYYVDLIAHGQLVTPVAVSDSHAHTSGKPGLNVTFLHTGGTLAEFGPDVLRTAMRARGTVASLGPYIDATMDGTWAPGREVAPGSLAVRVWSPSWIPVTAVALWRDGVETARVPCTGRAPEWCATSFVLPGDTDGSYVVVAESTAPITAVWPGDYAWAATSAVLVDAAGDGWTAPLGPLVVEP
ncbi:MAG: carboxypeptidase regulatory-like domain-containing protein [Myxococcales bacterium]|nr:carboxypeptidase regulatory-like domain-containing protein [Myxococcales bacterium]